jgi:hypothetical protein
VKWEGVDQISKNADGDLVLSSALRQKKPVILQHGKSTARVAPKRAHVAPKTAESAKRGSGRKKAPKATKKAGAARDGSKAAKVLDLLKRPNGVTLKELMKVTGWQPHSVRGFLSGTVGKKLGLTLTSTKAGDGQRTYSVQA